MLLSKLSKERMDFVADALEEARLSYDEATQAYHEACIAFFDSEGSVDIGEVRGKREAMRLRSAFLAHLSAEFEWLSSLANCLSPLLLTLKRMSRESPRDSSTDSIRVKIVDDSHDKP